MFCFPAEADAHSRDLISVVNHYFKKVVLFDLFAHNCVTMIIFSSVLALLDAFGGLLSIRSYQSISPIIGSRCYIDPSSVIVGDIVLGDDVSIWPLVAARGDVNTMRIGARTNIQDGTVLHVTRKTSSNPHGYPLVIGEDVTVGHHCMLHGCIIGNRVLVGMGAIIMDGAVVEDDVFIGAGTVVPPNKTLRSGYLYVGNPMIERRPISDTERAFLKQSAVNYVALKDEYLMGL